MRSICTHDIEFLPPMRFRKKFQGFPQVFTRFLNSIALTGRAEKHITAVFTFNDGGHLFIHGICSKIWFAKEDKPILLRIALQVNRIAGFCVTQDMCLVKEILSRMAQAYPSYLLKFIFYLYGVIPCRYYTTPRYLYFVAVTVYVHFAQPRFPELNTPAGLRASA